jgi:hypothetical protein
MAFFRVEKRFSDKSGVNQTLQLKSDSAINQALIRPSLILLIPGRTVAATPNSGSYAALRYISHESCIDNDRVGAESAGQDDRDSTPARMLGKRDTCPVV